MSTLTDLMMSEGLDFYKYKYYVGNNPTYRTAIATNTDPTAIAATEGMMTIFNSSTQGGTTNQQVVVCPLYIKLFCTVINASGTDFTIKVSTDTKNRYTSGGTNIVMNSTYVSGETGFSRPTSVSTVYFGDLTLPAASSEKQVGDVMISAPGSIAGQVLGDEYTILFGNWGHSSHWSSTDPQTAVVQNRSKQITASLSPVFLGTGASLILQPFTTAGAATGASWYVEVGILEVFHSPSTS